MPLKIDPLTEINFLEIDQQQNFNQYQLNKLTKSELSTNLLFGWETQLLQAVSMDHDRGTPGLGWMEMTEGSRKHHDVPWKQLIHCQRQPVQSQYNAMCGTAFQYTYVMKTSFTELLGMNLKCTCFSVPDRGAMWHLF